MRIPHAGALEERREQRAIVGDRFRLRRGGRRRAGATWVAVRRPVRRVRRRWRGLRLGCAAAARARDRARRRYGAPAGRRGDALPADPCPSHPATGRRRESRRRSAAASGRPGPAGWNASCITGELSAWVGPRNGVSRGSGASGSKSCGNCAEVGAMRRLGWSGSSNGLRSGRAGPNGSMANGSANGLSPTAPPGARRLLHQPHLDLVGAERAAGRRHAGCARRRRRSGRPRG